MIDKGKVSPAWNPSNLSEVQPRHVRQYLEEILYPLESKRDFFLVIPTEEYPSTKRNEYGPYSLIYRNKKNDDDGNGRFMTDKVIPDFYFYPNNFGLPSERELHTLLNHSSFESEDDVVKFFKRDISQKPGLVDHLKRILARKTSKTSQGKLIWISMKSV